nr:MAG TPA: hypothetical protein [Bacteriophage sp.]
MQLVIEEVYFLSSLFSCRYLVARLFSTLSAILETNENKLLNNQIISVHELRIDLGKKQQ